MKTFITRTITALFFVAVMLFGILYNDLSFTILCVLINVFALQEYFKMLQNIDPDYTKMGTLHFRGVTITSVGFLLGLTGTYYSTDFYLGIGEIGWIISFMGLMILPLLDFVLRQEVHIKNYTYSILGLLYITLPLAMLNDLRLFGNWLSEVDYLIPLLLIVCIWINDTMAYIVGSLIGKTPFFPSISPKKTIEGTVGGMILAMVTAAVFGYYFGSSWLAWYHWIVIAGIAAVFGTWGDLIESRLKRLAGVKDSGSIMPGHGGFLDRFDSLLIATPFLWVYINYFLPNFVSAIK
jgi:phosphatidate cytidylyltransferase